jgi:signal transduction histidine kinase
VTESGHDLLVDRYQKLIEISRDLSSTLDLNILLDHIVHAAADLCQAEAASILLYDQSREEMYFQAASNLEEPLIRSLMVPVEGSIAGMAIKEGKPINIADVKNNPHHYGSIEKSTGIETDSLLAIPMIAKEKAIGVLEAVNKLSGRFTEADQNLLMALGSQAAIAIENTLLFQQSDLISELIHELRTPLASLNAASHLLLREQVSEEQKELIVHTIQNETNRLNRMTSKFLDLSRLESGRVQFQIEAFDLKELIEECADIAISDIKKKNQDLKIDITDDLPHLKADRDKIKQVILNLLNNATKYAGDGDTIKVETQQDGGEIILRIIDNGPGIPPDYLPHIFEKFYRVPQTSKITQGTGLGLSICKRIIEAHGGRIAIQSSAGGGTTVSVRLPA